MPVVLLDGAFHTPVVQPRLVVPPELMRGPFRRADAHRLGVSAKTLRGPQFRRVLRGVYVPATAPDTVQLRYDAARLVLPSGSVASHRTAAELWQLPLPRGTGLHFTVPTVGRRSEAGVTSHTTRLGDDVQLLHGRALTSPQRTFADLAASRQPLGLVDLVILGDAAVRRRLFAPAELRAYVATMTGRGCRHARRAAALVRERVDSPMETRLRLLIVLAGLPEPEVNLRVFFADGSGWLATPDLLYPALRIAIEYDGEHHRTDRNQWRDDKLRGRLLRDDGWEVLECTADDVFQRPALTLQWLLDRLLARGAAELPPSAGDGWREHWGRQPV